ncbi:amidase signature domain-containing protein [Aspergillus avenaceus]|uniref:Amidase signature domain-containing protein n=1 Tax=Aspergillus avenaceus TaxID=36643 RepID=A0A5N6U8Q1_ASPAV|nr:amidase signature domain-containing protein [Aspergillus avenaceus]
MLFNWVLGLLLPLMSICATVCGQDCRSPLINASVETLQDELSGGCYTSEILVKAYITRINEVNSALHPIVEVNPDALHIAKELDKEREEGETRGPMHGIPVLIKDMIGTSDKMQTTAGSLALDGSRLDNDSSVVTSLRQSGAIILGKTSMSEWMNFRSSNTSNGWSPRSGQTISAYHLKGDPNGSSSGSAVAVDLGLAAVALGTETLGSILFPSEVNNIVGIKPTLGLTSRYNVIPLSERQDTIGPMARTVKDAARALQVIAGKDQKDNYTMTSPHETVPDYVSACQEDSLEGKRIGIPRNVLVTLGLLPYGAPVLAEFEKAVAVITDAGATIVPDANVSTWEEFSTAKSFVATMQADFASSIPRYLSKLKANPHNISNLEDLTRWTQREPQEEYPIRDTAFWDGALALGFDNTSPQFWALYQNNLRLGQGLLKTFEQKDLDAVILPTSVAPYLPGLVGTPAITVPLGAYPNGTDIVYNDMKSLVQIAPGIPFGISFLGKHWSESELIGMAYAFEQRTQVRQKLKRVIEPKSEVTEKPPAC